MPNAKSKQMVLQNFAGDRQLVIAAFEAFRPVISEYMENIRSAIAARHQSQLKFAVHTFKGAASNFQPVEVMRLTRNLHKAAEEADFELSANIFLELEQAIPVFEDTMDAWLFELTDQSVEAVALPTGGSVLVVDDDKFAIQLTATKLQKSGFKVDTRTDCTGLIEHIQANPYDLVLLDLVMGERSGLTVLQDIRKQFDHFQLPVIIVTGSESVEDVVACLNAGANDYLTKPLMMESTAARIQSQMTIKELYKQAIAAKEMEAIAKMIVTYNHEINNPLSIAMGFIGRSKKLHPETDFSKIEKALSRIQDIVKKISEIKADSESLHYLAQAKMFKVR